MALPDLNIDSNLHLSIADDFRNFGQIAWNEQTPEEKIWALSLSMTASSSGNH